MKPLITALKKLFSRSAKKSNSLPPEGSIYTHYRKGSAYNGMSGVVKHHEDGKSFMIECETNVLCNIRL